MEEGEEGEERRRQEQVLMGQEERGMEEREVLKMIPARFCSHSMVTPQACKVLSRKSKIGP